MTAMLFSLGIGKNTGTGSRVIGSGYVSHKTWIATELEVVTSSMTSFVS